MKYFISIATIEHYDSVEHSIYELNTENEHVLFDVLSEKISNSNSTPNMIHRAQEVLKSLKEQEILSYNSYKETSKDYNIDSTAEFETIIEKTEISLKVELHRNIFSSSPVLLQNRYLTHSISIQVLITN